jgi:hypothetical protein
MDIDLRTEKKMDSYSREGKLSSYDASQSAFTNILSTHNPVN